MRWGFSSRRDYHVLRSTSFSLWPGELGFGGVRELRVALFMHP